MMRRQIYDYSFLIILGLVLYGVLRLLSPFVGPLLVALMCAATFFPLYEAIQRILPRWNSSCQAGLTTVLVFLTFVTPIILLTWFVVQEATAIMPVLQQGRLTMDQWRNGSLLVSTPWMEHVRYFMSRVFGIRHAQFQQEMVQWVDASLAHVSLLGSLWARHTFVFLLDLLVMIFVLFFMFRDGATMANHGQSLIPLRLQNKEQLSERIHETVKGLARGLFLTSLIQGALATVGYLIVGAEGAFLLGALTAAAGLFPVVGTLGVSIPAAIFFLLKGSYPKGLFLLFWGLIVVVGIVDTLVRPYLIGKKFKLPLFAWFFSLWGGVEVWGAKGIILGPLLVAIAPSLLDIYRQRYLRQPPVAEKDITCGRLPYMT